MKCEEATSWLYFCMLTPSLPLLVRFTVQSLLAVPLRHLASMKEQNSWENNCALHKFRTLCEYLGRRGLSDY